MMKYEYLTREMVSAIVATNSHCLNIEQMEGLLSALDVVAKALKAEIIPVEPGE